VGCDIHLFVEKRNEKGAWEVQLEMEDETLKWTDQNGEKREKVYRRNRFTYDGRNYDLFAMLANVRNGSAFAGVKTGVGFVPIDHPRGLPDDVSEDVAEESDEWGIDGHSHSWILLTEWLDYDLDHQKTKHRITLKEDEYREYKKSGELPKMWGIPFAGYNVFVIPEEEYLKTDEQELEDLRNTDCVSPYREGVTTKPYIYIELYKETPYRECIGKEWTKLIEKCLEFPNPDDVRLVFWFDN
jgi:hypothetical protein